jgi:hypothetical protein
MICILLPTLLNPADYPNVPGTRLSGVLYCQCPTLHLLPSGSPYCLGRAGRRLLPLCRIEWAVYKRRGSDRKVGAGHGRCRQNADELPVKGQVHLNDVGA